MQYTIRNIPKNIDAALRRKAKSERKSLNQAAVDALGAGLQEKSGGKKKRNLRWMIRPLKEDGDQGMDETRRAFDAINPADWE